MKPRLVFDTELFGNRFLFCGYSPDTGERFLIWDTSEGFKYQLRDVMESDYTFVSFNGNWFDVPIISALLSGKSVEETKRIGNAIINEKLPPWKAARQFGFVLIELDHIDLIEVAPGKASLKSYGARMGMKRLQDMPFHHNAVLSQDDCREVERYCWNDVDTTVELMNRLSGQIALRQTIGAEYGLDLRSKSDAQMAEAVFMKELNLGRAHNTPPTYVTYTPPPFITFDSPELNTLLERVTGYQFVLNPSTGKAIFPEFLEEPIAIGSGVYQMGIGGLHSKHDKSVCHVARKDRIICDIDGTSFYPTMFVKGGFQHKRIGPKYVELATRFYHERVEAKRAKQKVKSESLKIFLNGGCFGKLGEITSAVYEPETLLRITISGQLMLLSMIEQVVTIGAEILTANTDGICVGATPEQMERIGKYVSWFEQLSGYEFEYVPYKSIALKDVNNYFAVKKDGSVKAKGIYAEPGLSKNPNAYICNKAVAEWLSKGTPVAETIRKGSLLEFLSARKVDGGAVQGDGFHIEVVDDWVQREERLWVAFGDESVKAKRKSRPPPRKVHVIHNPKELGKTVRWYMTNDRSYPPITYLTSGNKVPDSDGAKVLMELPDDMALPADLDFDWYIRRAYRAIKNIGAAQYLEENELEWLVPIKGKR